MTGSNPRHGGRFSKTPPFLIPGLVVVILILSFNYWRASRLNKELLERVAASDGRVIACSSELKTVQESLSSAERRFSDSQYSFKQEKDELKTENVW